jgi:hypothetical protein
MHERQVVRAKNRCSMSATGAHGGAWAITDRNSSLVPWHNTQLLRPAGGQTSPDAIERHLPTALLTPSQPDTAIYPVPATLARIEQQPGPQLHASNASQPCACAPRHWRPSMLFTPRQCLRALDGWPRGHRLITVASDERSR